MSGHYGHEKTTTGRDEHNRATTVKELSDGARRGHVWTDDGVCVGWEIRDDRAFVRADRLRYKAWEKVQAKMREAGYRRNGDGRLPCGSIFAGAARLALPRSPDPRAAVPGILATAPRTRKAQISWAFPTRQSGFEPALQPALQRITAQAPAPALRITDRSGTDVAAQHRLRR